jgi:hypothetical protein
LAFTTGCLGACSHGSGVRTGHAFDTSLSGFASSAPVKDGSFIAFGAAALRNTSHHAITLVSATPLFVGDVTMPPPRVAPMSDTPISAPDKHIGMDIDGYKIVPTEHDPYQQYGIIIEVSLNRGAKSGVVIGMDVRYKDQGHERVQRFDFVDLVCPWSNQSPQPCNDTYRGIRVFDMSGVELLKRLQPPTDHEEP